MRFQLGGRAGGLGRGGAALFTAARGLVLVVAVVVVFYKMTTVQPHAIQRSGYQQEEGKKDVRKGPIDFGNSKQRGRQR